MSVEALWSVKFVTDRGHRGAGVVVFETGRLFGGDSRFYFIGDFTVKENTITANVKVKHHGDMPPTSVWKDHDPEFELSIAGTFTESAMSAVATRPDMPGDMRMVFNRLAELPSGVA